MKKLNYFLLGAAALTLASCSNDDLQAPNAGDGNVQITVNLPSDAMGTRADFGSGTTSKVLKYAVYDISATSPVLSFEGQADFGTSTSTTLSLNLLNKNYKIAFFAQSAQSETEGVYTFAANQSSPSISVDYAKMTSATNNADGYDCFYNLETVNLATDTQTSFDVTLYRPVAQVNWGANDIGKTQELTNTFGQNGQYIMTSLSVSEIPTSLDLFSGDVSGSFSGAIGGTDYFAIPQNQKYPVNPTVNQYVAIQYILVGAPANISGLTTEAAIYDFTLDINNSGDNEVTEYKTDVAVANAPLKANYQTNIYGALLSNNATFEIQVIPNFAGSNSVDTDNGAVVEITKDGTVNCITPALPDGVTEEDMEGQGAVALDENGNPVYFEATGKSIAGALKNYSEIYFAPNATIDTQSHIMEITQSVTIHGNGATISGGEQDFSVNLTYPNGSVIDLNINNLNNAKVWGAPKAATEDGTFTINLTMTNCTMTATGRTNGSLSLTNLSNDNPQGPINMTFENCHVQEAQLGVYTKYPGTITGKNCVFTNVGIPFNINNRTATLSNVTFTGNTFISCGISPEDTVNSAYNYAAPIRVVASKAANSINLLVDNCLFENTLSQWDILLMDYREGYEEKWHTFSYTIQNCIPANPSVRAN